MLVARVAHAEQPRALLVRPVRLEEVGTIRRRQRPRQQPRCEHGEGHAQGQRLEEVLAHAVEEDDGEEDGHRGDGRHQHRHGDLAGGVQGRLHRRLAHVQVAKGVFDVDDRVIDQPAHDQGQSAQGHEVQCVAGEVEADYRHQRRQRDGQSDDQGRAHAADEEQHHQRGQHGPQDAFPEQVVDGVANKHGLIGDDVQLEGFLQLSALGVLLRRQPVDEVGDALLDSLDDFDGVAAGPAQDGDVNRLLPFPERLAGDAHQVGLDGGAVRDAADGAEINLLPEGIAHRVADLHGHVVQVGGLVRHVIDGQEHILVVEVCRHARFRAQGQPPRRDHRAALGQSPLHVHETQVARVQLLRIELAVDAPQLAAEHRRGDHPGGALEHVADVEVGELVDLGFVQDIAGSSEIRGRQRGRGVVQHDHRRHGSRRQVVEIGGGEAGDLGKGGVGVHALAEVVADHTDADHRPRFLPLDADRLAGPALDAVGDRAVHELRRHARIQGQHLHGGRLISRQDIHGHAADTDVADDHDEQAEHDYQVRVGHRHPHQPGAAPFAGFERLERRLRIGGPALLLGLFHRFNPRGPDTTHRRSRRVPGGGCRSGRSPGPRWHR